MSPAIRIVLLLGAIALFVYVVLSIRKSKMRIEDTVFWICISALILLLSIFPGIASWVSRALGFMSPISLVYLFFIAILLWKCFLLSRDTSQLETKVKELSQQVAVDRLEHHDRTHGADSAGNE